MEIGTIMNTLRDAAGIPAPPAIFQALMLLTWVFHIAFVHMTLGAAGIALWSFWHRDRSPFHARLSSAMTQAAKVGVSLLIVLGVAPLLFTQVIYDPQWYTSNVLSARWAIGFIFSLIVAYCLWFAFYSVNHAEDHGPGAPTQPRHRALVVLGGLALALFALDGLIMHVLSVQAIQPDRWMQWYAPDGVVDTSGSKLHTLQPGRYLTIMGLALPAAGMFLLAYADYFSVRRDVDAAYLDWVRQLAKPLAWKGLLLVAVLFLGWQLENWHHGNLLTHPVGWLFWLSLLGAAGWIRGLHRTEGHGYTALAIGVSSLALLAIWREVIRIAYLAPFSYSAGQYTVHADWPSLALFTLTILGIGGLVGGFYLRLLYQAGRTQGVYQASPGMARMGSAAVGVLAVWVAVFFAYGIGIYVNNVFR